MRKNYILLFLAALLAPLGAKAQITEFPYTLNFENGLDGWTAIDADGDGYTWEVSSSTDGIPSHSGSAMATSRSYSTSNVALTPDNWLVSPAIVLDNTVRQLSWWHHTQDPSYPAEHYAVYISTTGNTVADFTDEPVYETTLTAADNEYNIHQVMLNGYEGETIYIAFRHYNCTDMFYFHLDDISIEAAPNCLPPENLAFENITTTGADMTFDMPACATDGVRFLINGEEQPVLTSGSYSFTNLEPGTVYTIHLYSLCGDGDTSYATTAQFMTECVNITLPYLFDFEGDHANCYNYEHMYWRTEASNAHSGNIAFYSSGSTGHYVVTPVIEAPEDADGNIVFEFYALPLNSTYYGTDVTFKLYVSTEASLEFDSTFSVVMDTAISGNDYMSIKLNLAPYAGQNITIAIENTTNGSPYLFIDDIAVRSTNSPVVSMPASSATNINTTLTINATMVEGDTNSLTWAWSSVMADAGDATIVDNGTSMDITYTATGTDTVTVILTNSFGSATAKTVVNVFDLNPVSEFPYSTGFEATATDNANWMLINGANGWYIDTAVNNGGSASLYISSDSGATNSYVGTATYSYAYRAITIAESGDYAVSFDWRAQGESTWDYMRVFLAPGSTEFSSTSASDISTTTLPDGFIALDGGSKLNLNGTDWTTQTAVINITNPGLYLLTFYWRNDGSVNNNPPAAIDNVAFNALSCSSPIDLTVDTVDIDLLGFHWTPSGDESQWLVQVGDSIEQTVTDTFFVATDLETYTFYEISVRALCGNDDTSFAATLTTRTLRVLNPADLPYSTGFEVTEDDEDNDNLYWFRDNGSNGWYIDTAAHNGGSYGLYISADSGSTYGYDIASSSIAHAYRAIHFDEAGQYAVSFDWQANGESNYDYIRAYLAPADAILATSYSDITYGSLPNGFIAIDGGDRLNQSTGWQTATETFTIDAPVTMLMVFSWRNDASVGSQPPAAIDNIDVRMLSCPQPTAIAVDSTGSDYIAFSWVPGGEETEWEVTIDSVSTVVTDTFYVAEDLEANTAYSISVRAICGEGDTSFATTAEARTECSDITIPYFEGFENGGEACWHILNYYSSSTYTDVTTSYSYSGTHSHAFYPGYDYQPVFAVLPRMNEVNTMMVNFMVKGSSYSTVTVGTMASASDTTTFVPLYSINALTTQWIEQEVHFDADTTGNEYIAFRFGVNGSWGYYAYLDDVNVMVAPSCQRPESVSATDIETTSATITITDTTEVNNYQIIVVNTATGDTAYNDLVNSTSQEVTGLTAFTEYTVTAYAVCDDGTITLSVNTTFRTACENGNCEFTVALADTYGDGWNGNAINVWQNGELFTSLTIANGSAANANVSVCLGSPVELIWQSGSYAYETSFTITSADDSVILALDGDSLDSGDTLVVFDGLCGVQFVYSGDIVDTTEPEPGPQPLPCNAPTITGATATDNNVTVIWNGTASNYEVAIVEGAWQEPADVVTTTGPGYTFTGLQASTQYTVGVRAVCADTVSNWATRNVTTAAPADTTDTIGIRLAETALFSLYPNPATTTVTVDLGSHSQATVAVIDQSGRLNGEWRVENGKLELNVGRLAKGAYYVRVTTAESTSVRKLIVR